jgi:hypothetical protein
VNFEPGFGSTNKDPLVRHKLHRISRNIKYFDKEDMEICLDIFIVSQDEQEEHILELLSAKIENVFRTF